MNAAAKAPLDMTKKRPSPKLLNEALALERATNTKPRARAQQALLPDGTFTGTTLLIGGN